MATQSDFDRLVSETNPDLQPICKHLKSVVAKLDPKFVEVVWPRQRIASYGVGPKKMTEHYVYVAPQSKHVNLGLYHGAVVEDPDELLEGTGKRLRHVKIRTLAEAKAAPIKKLVNAAIAERKEALR